MKKSTTLPAPVVKAAAGMPNSATIVAAGYNAWKELKRQKTYERWLSVGRAFNIGRTICLNASGANAPKGQPYTGYFSEWLRCEGFDGVSKSERRDLFKVMENEHEITAWRESLDDDEKRRVNHPETVWRKWQAFVHKPARPTAASKLFKEMKKMHNVDQGVREPSFEAEVARALETIEEITDDGRPRRQCSAAAQAAPLAGANGSRRRARSRQGDAPGAAQTARRRGRLPRSSRRQEGALKIRGRPDFLTSP